VRTLRGLGLQHLASLCVLGLRRTSFVHHSEEVHEFTAELAWRGFENHSRADNSTDWLTTWDKSVLRTKRKGVESDYESVCWATSRLIHHRDEFTDDRSGNSFVNESVRSTTEYNFALGLSAILSTLSMAQHTSMLALIPMLHQEGARSMFKHLLTLQTLNEVIDASKILFSEINERSRYAQH
jgi:hypothetical protein